MEKRGKRTKENHKKKPTKNLTLPSAVSWIKSPPFDTRHPKLVVNMFLSRNLFYIT